MEAPRLGRLATTATSLPVRFDPAPFAVALAWLYQGVWCKLLNDASRHLEVVASVPVLGGTAARWSLITLGLIETALAVWVLTGLRPRSAAVCQTVLLVTMNAGGLVWAGNHIPDPAGMIVNNIVFLVLVWSVVTGQRPVHGCD